MWCRKNCVFNGTTSTKRMLWIHLEVSKKTRTSLMSPWPVRMWSRWRLKRWSLQTKVLSYKTLRRNKRLIVSWVFYRTTFGRHSLFKLHIFARGLYSNEQQSEEERDTFQHLKGFSKKIPAPQMIFKIICGHSWFWYHYSFFGKAKKKNTTMG